MLEPAGELGDPFVVLHELVFAGVGVVHAVDAITLKEGIVIGRKRR